MNEHELLVKMESVSVAFYEGETNLPAVREVSLSLRRGEWVALVGRNGSGKSTLARVLAGIWPVTAGNVRRNPAQGPSQLVLQQPDAQIVGETVYEDLCFGMENFRIDPVEMPARAITALREVGLTDIALERETSAMSGGQKQLLAVAGCLAVGAELLIFDEVTSMLDPLARERVLQAVSKLHCQGKTIVWVTQWPEEIGRAERVVAMEQGAVMYDGGVRSFFYGEFAAGSCSSGGAIEPALAPAARIGIPEPFAVAMGRRLLELGADLPLLPVTEEEAYLAVSAI